MTTSLREMQSTLDSLLATRERIARLHREMPSGWREEYVQERRALSACLAELANGAATPGADDERLQACRRQLQRALSLLRSRLANHQANWPAVLADPQSTAYRESFAQLGPAYAAVKGSLDRLSSLAVRR